MCYHPLHIVNPKTNKNSFRDRDYLHVPCGKCLDCLDEKRISWFIRMSYEHMETLDNGGFSFYITLTYNEESVPHIGSTKVFRKHDIEQYIQTLRLRIKRYLHLDHYDSKLRFFYSGEYGGKTHRPHYHVVFFCNDPINKWKFRNFAMSIWRKQYGFVKCGNNYGFIESLAPFNYCAKYVCKDTYPDSWVNKLSSSIQKDFDLGIIDSDWLKDQQLQYLPPHRASNNLGLYVLQCEDFRNLQKGFVILSDTKLNKRKYKLPLYLDRKIFFNVELNKNGNPMYVLNDLGNEMKLIRKIKYEEAFKKSFIYLMSQHGDSENLRKINYKFKTQFRSYEELHKFILSRGTLSDFTDYVTTYKGYTAPLLTYHYTSPSHNLSTNHFLKRYAQQEPSLEDLLDFSSVIHYYHDKDFPMITDIIEYSTFLINKSDEQIKETLRKESQMRTDVFKDSQDELSRFR